MMIVSIPLPAGHPNKVSIDMKINNKESPITTSGITKGAEASAESNKRPLKRPRRTKQTAINIPNIVEMVAATPAINRDFDKADNNCSFCKSSKYHFVEKPAQTEANLPELKLKAIITSAGIYKSAKPITPRMIKIRGT